MCERCVIDARGPLATCGIKLERRTGDDQVEHIRVAANVFWDGTLSLGSGGSLVTMRSDWYQSDADKRSPISDFIEAMRPPA